MTKKLSGKLLNQVFEDEWRHFDSMNHPMSIHRYVNKQSMLEQQWLYNQQAQHTNALNNQIGGLEHGNWATPQAAHSSTSNVAGTAGQLPRTAISAQSISQALAALRAMQPGAVTFWDPGIDPNREPLKSAGVKFGEFLGWRMWFMHNGFLRSYSQDVTWAPKQPMLGKPSDYGSDGIWAFKDKSRAINKMLESHQESTLSKYRASNEKYTVYGSVHLYGDVVEHDDGYRASAAKIVSLDDIIGPWASKTDRQETLKDLQERYL